MSWAAGAPSAHDTAKRPTSYQPTNRHPADQTDSKPTPRRTAGSTTGNQISCQVIWLPANRTAELPTRQPVSLPSRGMSVSTSARSGCAAHQAAQRRHQPGRRGRIGIGSAVRDARRVPGDQVTLGVCSRLVQPGTESWISRQRHQSTGQRPAMAGAGWQVGKSAIGWQVGGRPSVGRSAAGRQASDRASQPRPESVKESGSGSPSRRLVTESEVA